MNPKEVLAAMNEELHRIDAAQALREYNAAYDRWVHATDADVEKYEAELCKARSHFMSF